MAVPGLSSKFRIVFGGEHCLHFFQRYLISDQNIGGLRQIAAWDVEQIMSHGHI